MYYYISGKLACKKELFIVIDVAGVGYKIYMAPAFISQMPSVGETVKVYTYTNVKEDAMDLYGFLSEGELSMFEMLLSVSGVGPKAALAILATVGLSNFALAVVTDDYKTIVEAPGIGPKTAKRIILELKDKMKTDEAIDTLKEAPRASAVIQQPSKKSEVVSALVVLGYGGMQARQAVNAIYEDELSLEDNIKKALAKISE